MTDIFGCKDCGAPMVEGLDECEACCGTGRDSTELDGCCIRCHGAGETMRREWPDCVCEDEHACDYI